MEDMGNDPDARERALRAPAPERARQHADRHGRGPVRRPPQPVRLLPLDHRRQLLLRAARRAAHPAPGRSREGAQHAELQLHHARPLPRRPRRAVRERRAGRPGERRRLAARVGAADHRLGRVQARRAAARDLRRGGGGGRAPPMRAPAATRPSSRTRPTTAARRPGAAAAAWERWRCRRSSGRGRSPATRTTTSPRCGRSSSCSACRRSATRARPTPAALGRCVHGL